MYKVFLNDREINIVGTGNITLTKPCCLVEGLSSVKAVQRWFDEFSKGEIQCVTISDPNPKEFFERIFVPVFLAVPAAGGVAIRNNRLLFIFRGGKWDLPKGKIDKGEDAGEAALREVEEECGISGHKITKQLSSTFHIYQSPYKKTLGQWILKETFWFEMSYSGVNSGIPQTDENITKLQWFAKNELGIVLENTYENLKPIIEGYNT